MSFTSLPTRKEPTFIIYNQDLPPKKDTTLSKYDIKSVQQLLNSPFLARLETTS